MKEPSPQTKLPEAPACTHRRIIVCLVALFFATGCGRIGYELLSGPGAGGGGAAGGASDVDSGIASGGMGAGGQLIDGGAADGRPNESGGEGGVMDGGSYTCTPGAPELCDGRDNNCDLAIDETGCPFGCGGQAWGNHGYMLCDSTNYTWDEAKAECEGAGLQLARIDSQAENDFVNGFVFAARRGEVWIGGSDLATEGDWRWTDGTPFWSGLASPAGTAVGEAYTHWYTPTEPDGQNSSLSGAANCLSFIPLQGGAWVDQGCNYFRRALCRTP